MMIYFAADHAGLTLKGTLIPFVQSLGYEVEDCGAHEFNPEDDYPDFVVRVAEKISQSPDSMGIVLGGSGQGEAIAANRFPGVRAVVYYGKSGVQEAQDGKQIDIIQSVREHNNANVLSLGARFIHEDEAKEVVQTWLTTPFAGDERHRRRIEKLK